VAFAEILAWVLFPLTSPLDGLLCVLEKSSEQLSGARNYLQLDDSIIIRYCHWQLSCGSCAENEFPPATCHRHVSCVKIAAHLRLVREYTPYHLRA